MSFWHDISQSKGGDGLPRNSERQYRLLFEANPHPMWVYDRENLSFLAVNDAAAQSYGYSREEFLAMTVNDIRPPGRIPAGLERVPQDGSTLERRVTQRHWKKDGTIIDVEITESPLMFAGRPAVLLMTIDITQRKLVEEQLRKSFEAVRALAARLENIREEERSRVAREIHDELGQSLTAIKMDLFYLLRKLPEDRKQPRRRAEDAFKVIGDTIQSVRRIVSELRPSLLDDLGLAAAIDWEAQHFQARSGIKCRVFLPNEDLALDQERATAIFRIFQETLTNVARHANATLVEVRLQKGAEELRMEVKDNGKGIKESQASGDKCFGLLGMRERALLLGGEFKIRGIPERGTAVDIRIPLDQPTAT